MARVALVLLLFVFLGGMTVTGCNHSKRVYATCYCTAPVTTGSIAVVISLCGPCKDKPASQTEPPPFDDDGKPGKGPK